VPAEEIEELAGGRSAIGSTVDPTASPPLATHPRSPPRASGELSVLAIEVNVAGGRDADGRALPARRQRPAVQARHLRGSRRAAGDHRRHARERRRACPASEAVFREALELLVAYAKDARRDAAPETVGDPRRLRIGFSLVRWTAPGRSARAGATDEKRRA
jgi:hypothetical protein